jgi:predicted Zn-dependent protease
MNYSFIFFSSFSTKYLSTDNAKLLVKLTSKKILLVNNNNFTDFTLHKINSNLIITEIKSQGVVMLDKLKQKLVELTTKFSDYKIVFNLKEWETDFLRFFQSQTNYNISKYNLSLETTIYKGKKSTSFTISQPNPLEIETKILEVIGIIDDLPEDPDFKDIEADTRKNSEKIKPNNIEKISLEKKTELLQKIADVINPKGFKLYGTFICNYITNWIINSNGVDKMMTNSPIMFEVKAVSQTNEVTVLKSYGAESFDKFDLDDFIADLAIKVETATKPIVDVDPGEYEVVLSPRSIGELLQYLSWGMHAGTLDRKMSFFEGKENQKIFPENITITDNPKSDLVINYDYDGNGHVYDETKIIENGVFKNYLVDNYYGRKMDMEINGGSGECLIMTPGNIEVSEMIKGIKKGLFISSFHYMNFINMKETSITGLTRDGTFLIEDGQIVNVVNNLRFTQTIDEVFNRITELENKSHPVPFSENYGQFGISTVVVPHVKVDGFKISSSTKTI